MELNSECYDIQGRVPDYGAIFMSSATTRSECFRLKLFGLPPTYANFVKQIRAGMILFLFEYESRMLYGVFEAQCDGGMNIDPQAYKSTGKQFPAQVSFSVIWKCIPVPEAEFRNSISENYFSAKKFHFGLSKQQVYKLLQLFSSRKVQRQPKVSSVTNPKGHFKDKFWGNVSAEKFSMNCRPLNERINSVSGSSLSDHNALKSPGSQNLYNVGHGRGPPELVIDYLGKSLHEAEWAGGDRNSLFSSGRCKSLHEAERAGGDESNLFSSGRLGNQLHQRQLSLDGVTKSKQNLLSNLSRNVHDNRSYMNFSVDNVQDANIVGRSGKDKISGDDGKFSEHERNFLKVYYGHTPSVFRSDYQTNSFDKAGATGDVKFSMSDRIASDFNADNNVGALKMIGLPENIYDGPGPRRYASSSHTRDDTTRDYIPLEDQPDTTKPDAARYFISPQLGVEDFRSLSYKNNAARADLNPDTMNRYLDAPYSPQNNFAFDIPRNHEHLQSNSSFAEHFENNAMGPTIGDYRGISFSDAAVPPGSIYGAGNCRNDNIASMLHSPYPDKNPFVKDSCSNPFPKESGFVKTQSEAGKSIGVGSESNNTGLEYVENIGGLRSDRERSKSNVFSRLSFAPKSQTRTAYFYSESETDTRDAVDDIMKQLELNHHSFVRPVKKAMPSLVWKMEEAKANCINAEEHTAEEHAPILNFKRRSESTRISLPVENSATETKNDMSSKKRKLVRPSFS